MDNIKEISIVRENLMTKKGYTGYCGSELCKPRMQQPMLFERWPRTKFNGVQFVCPKCNWISSFPKDFISRYKNKWKL